MVGILKCGCVDIKVTVTYSVLGLVIILHKGTVLPLQAYIAVSPQMHCNLSSYTHTRLTARFSGTTRVSQYQKGKTNLDFTEARDSEWQVASAGPYASLHLAPDRQPRQHPTTQVFYRPDALPAAQPTASKH